MSQLDLALIVRTGRRHRSVVVVLGVGGHGVFVGYHRKAIAQGEIGRVAGETATSFGLSAKVELCHRTHSQRGGSPAGRSRSPAAG